MHRMFITAAPISMRSVRANTWWASCRKSAFSPTSPCQWGMTGLRLPFWTSELRWDSAIQATPKPRSSAACTWRKKLPNISASVGVWPSTGVWEIEKKTS